MASPSQIMSAVSRSGRIQAAQYLRMSSENQRYSTENQQNAIAEYAEQHGYSVVASYIDAGKSGLSLKGRDALKQLLSDALATPRLFDAILVLDVSRWGRFQNPDQAAHYEFLCRQAGVRVLYVNEPFGEDVAPITTIIKHLKRVMAGEYSRELSVKLSRAKRQQAQLGFRQGGSILYGFRRLLVDPARNPRQILKPGEAKALDVDKVIVMPGPPEELAVIRRIFRLYVQYHLTFKEIAKRLSKTGVRGYGDKPLSVGTIRNIVSNELCIGQMTYNLTAVKLQGRPIKNPEELWTRASVFEPIVPINHFRKAQELRSRSAKGRWDKENIIESLQKFHHYYGDDFKVECPTGSERFCTIEDVAEEIAKRLQRLFLKDEHGLRPVLSQYPQLQNDPHFRDYVPFYEYFHGDTGRGAGASHQTGWTGLVAKLLTPRAADRDWKAEEREPIDPQFD